MDEVAVVPEDLRCKRSDGKQWRCSARCMPYKTVCEKHYFQAKKRAANSALRASHRLPRRCAPPSPRPDPQIDDRPVPHSLPETSVSPPLLTCHQCRRSDRTRVVRCVACDRRGYCDTCIARWYVDFTVEELHGACPACRGICSCSVCRRVESLIKGRIREISSLEKLNYFYGLMSCVLPVLKKIHDEQCFERDLENKLYGVENDIPRARMNLDEQMCCDVCGIPIVDYHRHCADCTADFCIDCCREVRRNVTRGDLRNHHATDGGWEASSSSMKAESYDREDRFNCTFQHSFPSWRASSDGSIRCPGDHCSSPLMLRRIFKINWVSKLAKNVEEMVNGCIFSDSGVLDKCIYCSLVSSSTTSKELSSSNLYRCSERQSGDNHLYTPTALDIRCEGIFHFRKHWANGEPIIVRKAVDCLTCSNWDPRSIWLGIIKTTNDGPKEDGSTVIKAMDCLTRSEVEIELEDFIRGYFERHIREDGKPRLLKSKEWPSSGALEEFLRCQRPLVFKELPLLEFIHSKWGLLNLAAKLPNDLVQTDAKPQLYVAYGSEEEQEQGDSVVDLNVNISDTVYILMHSAKVDFHVQNLARFGTTTENSAEYLLHKSPRDRHHHHLQDGNGRADDQRIEKVAVGAVWDVFRRQDTSKLNEYLSQSSESWDSNISMNEVTNPLHDRTHFLHEVQKQKLKKQAGIEPWTFKQRVGEAVFVPAGCAFQLRNLKPCVQLVFTFHSPESLSASMRVAQDIRRLPNEHPAKLQMLEVGKMPLYASSWVIRETQKMILDPKVGEELGFEDRNLTEMVSDNLKRLKRSRITCK